MTYQIKVPIINPLSGITPSYSLYFVILLSNGFVESNEFVEMEIHQPDVNDSLNLSKTKNVVEETITTTSPVSNITSFTAYGVSITAHDIASLAPCEMINDNTVTVFLR